MVTAEMLSIRTTGVVALGAVQHDPEAVDGENLALDPHALDQDLDGHPVVAARFSAVPML